ncbi:hypothetical protein GCM10025789_18860 [Tessaracoccus lubricantis]|uniref:Nicotinate-nucleotide--dimethylbenzimidazole phosphoribosyltransferase n=2 Tax=Tessaracoccus lubricantis TaxID=545543 RepID=A0ABP9FEL2_9ACTN
MSLLDTTLAAIKPVSEEALAAAERRQNELTKPPGSLGHLETVGNRLAAIAGVCPPPVPEPAVIGLFAGDHGVCAQGVSPWPQEVTVQMMLNIGAGGAAINVLGRQAGADVWVTNVGVAADAPDHPAVRDRNVRRGTADFTEGPAMTLEEARAAVEVGIATAFEAVDGGARCLLTGEMGIGNTTPSSALISVFTGTDAATVTGRGAGADDEMLDRKVDAIERGLALHQPDPADALGTVAAVGGLEQAAIAGFILGAAARRVPVVLDGVIACSAACVAVAFDDDVRGYLISGHAGAEPGIQAAVAHLGLRPLVDLGLRLGEGSGAAVALPMVQASARILNDMATFASAGVSEG